MKKIYLILPIIAGFMFGSTGIYVRTLTQNGIDSTTLLFLRFSIGWLIILLAILLTDRKLLDVKLNDLPLFLICAACIVGLNLCYNSSINLIPLSLAAVLLSTAPVFVLIFAFILFREKITSKKFICMILVIIGCTLASGLLEENIAGISNFGLISGVGAAVFWAIYMMASRKSIDRGKHTFTILFYALIFISIGLLPFTNFAAIKSFISNDYLSNIIFLIMHSTTSFALPYIFSTLSLTYLDSGIASILLSGSEPLAALLMGLIFYSEVPTGLMFIGMILTIAVLIVLSRISENKQNNS